MFDTTTPEGFSSALRFANNFFTANASGYGLKDSDLAVVIIARHHSTQFAYNKTIWTKYRNELVKAAGVINVARRGRASERVAQARCPPGGLSAGDPPHRWHHREIRQRSQDKVYEELAANLVRNAHLVPAGIVAVNRAQERGYSLANAG